MRNHLPGKWLLGGLIFSCTAAGAQHTFPRQVTFVDPVYGQHVVESASQSITAYNCISSGYVTYAAGQAIVLKPGFHVARGASFRGMVGQEVKSIPKIPKALQTSGDIAQVDLKIFPNPFIGDAQIIYAIPEVSPVNLSVFNSEGIEVTRLVDMQLTPAGKHTALFRSSHLSPGIYTYVISTRDTRKVFKAVKQ